MKQIGFIGALTVALGAASVAAHAADLYPGQAHSSPAAMPVYNWTGIYLGINGGYGWGRQDPLSVLTSQYDKVGTDIDGWMFGGTFGAQIQSGRVVLGVEGDIDWANIKGTVTVVPTILGAPGPTARLATEAKSFSTVRVRVGYAAQNWLVYGTGGLAVLNNDTNVSLVGVDCGSVGNLPCSGESTRIGITAGGGIEYGFTPNWSAKLEYLWVDAASDRDAHINTVRAGINYRFGGN